MPQLDLIFELAKADLSASRLLLTQVADYIRDHYGFTGAELPAFFRDKYPTLEDYEVDLTFSPQFTPSVHNRLDYIPLLGDRALSRDDIRLLKQRLVDAKLTIAFKASDEAEDITVPVHETFIDRYINLLKLDQKLPAAIYEAIATNVPDASRNVANLLGRDDTWQNPVRQDILLAYLRVFKAQGNFTLPKLVYLTNFVRTYRPGSVLDLDRQFDSLIQSCETDMENVSGRGFHDEYLKVLYATQGTGLNRSGTSDDNVWHHYREMMDMSRQLKADFQHLPDVCPELLERARKQQQPV